MLQPDVIFVKPAEGRLVRHPVDSVRRGAKLASEGEFVPRGAFWLRRLRDADVIEAAPPATPDHDPVAAPAPRSKK